jgi:hypothetical protein
VFAPGMVTKAAVKPRRPKIVDRTFFFSMT